MYTVRWNKFRYTSTQFGLWRIAFGVYLVFYALRLMPYGTELYSHAGPYARADLFRNGNSYFPDFLLNFDSVDQVRAIMFANVALSILIMIGFARRSAALTLWFLMCWLINRNPGTDSPEFGFVNWLIFALIFIPIGENFSLTRKDKDWQMPVSFYWGAWIVLAAGYFYAGSSKFKGHDPSWMDGRAMFYVMTRDDARFGWYGDFFDAIPMPFYCVLTWFALCLQTFAALFIYLRKLRPWWWLASTGVHVSLLFFINLGQLTWGMVLFQLFLFDMSWWDQIRSSVFLRLNRR